jgi:hypothetical protein
MWHDVVRENSTNISEECNAFIVRVEGQAMEETSKWGSVCVFIFTAAVRTSDPANSLSLSKQKQPISITSMQQAVFY